MSTWKLEAGRCITTPDGTFYLTYGRTTDGSNAPRFRDPAELDRIARQVAVLPELLDTLREAERCAVALCDTDAMPRDTCPADLLDMVRAALEAAK